MFLTRPLRLFLVKTLRCFTSEKKNVQFMWILFVDFRLFCMKRCFFQNDIWRYFVKMVKEWQLVLVVLCFVALRHIVCCMAASKREKRSFLGVDQLQRKGRKCHDFCAIFPEICRNGGTCVTNENTCIGSCLCAPGWTGQWCKDSVTKNDYNEDMIMENDISTTSDVNDVIEGVPSSDIMPDMSTTSFDELRNDILQKLRGGFFTLKPLFLSTVPPLRRKESIGSLAMNESQDGEDDLTLRKKCENSCVNGECIKINGPYKCKQRVNVTANDVPKVCGPGFECVHGVCDLEELKKNSYSCICESNYVGQFCTVKCPFDCGEHGYCDIDREDNSYKCFCQWNYTGLNCSELVPEDLGMPPSEEIIFHWYVVGVSVAMVIVVVSAVFVLAYFLWRRRLVFMLKIVHYFQQYEDDDGKQFDAFVSYKSCPRDEEFVLHQLFPKLEGEYKFKLCMHFRDFIPGEAIANNIVTAIENSRRTIMILSPEYVQSEWCRMEYQKAQHEMLKLKHKIIPIVLADISEVKNTDKNLKSIINSVTYLEWPGQENSKKAERFWKKLELSLPKKSSLQCLQTQSDSSESFSESVTDTDIKSSKLVPSNAIGSCIPSAVIRSESDSPTPISVSKDDISPKFQKHKRKDFKHFMDKLVRTKIFSRQDSNSSQSALVDDETLASRSSCGSVSDSMLSESSESICSTPDTARSYLNEINEDPESNTFLTSVASDSDLSLGKRHVLRRNSLRGFDRQRQICERSKVVKRNKECLISSECEKDHCEGTQCFNCESFAGSKKNASERNSQEFLNKGFQEEPSDRLECEYCLYNRNRSDNNRIRISAIEGSDKLRIQRLPCDIPPCQFCDHVINRSQPFRGSVKQHKDAQNFEIMMQKQKRVASLPRNYKSVTRQSRDTVLNANVLQENAHFQNNSNFYIDVCENV